MYAADVATEKYTAANIFFSVIFVLFIEAVNEEFVGNKSFVISRVTGALRQQWERKIAVGVFLSP